MKCPNCGAENPDWEPCCRQCAEELEPPEFKNRSEPDEFEEGGGPDPGGELLWAVLAMIFCCLPFGVVATAYAVLARSREAGGDLEGARRDAASARGWLSASIVFSFVQWGVVHWLRSQAG